MLNLLYIAALIENQVVLRVVAFAVQDSMAWVQ